MKKFKIFLTIGCVLVAVGLCIVLYAPVRHMVNRSRMNSIVDDFTKTAEQIDEEKDENEPLNKYYEELDRIKQANPDTDYDVGKYIKDNNISAKKDDIDYRPLMLEYLREDAQNYNQDLITNGQLLLNDPFSYEQVPFDLTQYGIEDDVFGYIESPVIDMKLPIYLGATNDNLARGAVHLTYSSLPIGGESSNAVLAGHRGYIGGVFFDNIVFLEEGDDVYVTNFWEELHYKVIEKEIISPYDIDRCYIQEGKDLITLLTCHPYGYTTYRYMVVCERV